MNRVWLRLTGARDLSAAAWELLEQALGFPPPETARGAHGKPYFPAHPSLQFSLSHTRGAVACALSDRPCGVDLEPLSRPVRPGFARRYFTEAERAYAGGDPARFFEVWTRKEALLKRDGRGLSVPLREVETVGHPLLATKIVGGFALSFCGEPPGFELIVN